MAEKTKNEFVANYRVPTDKFKDYKRSNNLLTYTGIFFIISGMVTVATYLDYQGTGYVVYSVRIPEPLIWTTIFISCSYVLYSLRKRIEGIDIEHHNSVYQQLALSIDSYYSGDFESTYEHLLDLNSKLGNSAYMNFHPVHKRTIADYCDLLDELESEEKIDQFFDSTFEDVVVSLAAEMEEIENSEAYSNVSDIEIDTTTSDAAPGYSSILYESTKGVLSGQPNWIYLFGGIILISVIIYWRVNADAGMFTVTSLSVLLTVVTQLRAED
ncbi:hypothetical protein [Haloarchaeobius litoreus]|uniref:SMODS and SLOG-associating 2TM effector domain-containing protein n=1 Tax=Haloarchaeobius litoreus TaxID=755306 RepID=A0ABD6DJS6_9EURY|nr:hypothetical protein [Haloarchaeobius litoreus]